MSEPFLGEVKMWAFNWAPRNWALCDGSILPIQQNSALYSLLGTNFGGDGKVTFGLPDLRGRTPIGFSTMVAPNTPYKMGAKGGAETVSLTVASVPPHAHEVVGYTTNAGVAAPTGANLATVVSLTSGSTTNFSTFLPSQTWTADVLLNAGTISTEGGGAAHDNMQPYSVVNFTICTLGNYPPRP